MPLKELKISNTLKTRRGANVYGLYHPGAAKVEIGFDLHRAKGSGLVPGKSWSTTEASKTDKEARQAAVLHETAHHIHMVDGQGSLADSLVKAAFSRAKSNQTFITVYAAEDRHEYFAESAAAYFLHRSELQTHDPNGYAMVEAVLRLRGILP